jgi:hypothetical protein
MDDDVIKIVEEAHREWEQFSKEYDRNIKPNITVPFVMDFGTIAIELEYSRS